jgi:hypothetical protein
MTTVALRPDYTDVFEVTIPASDPRSAEAFARLAVEGAPWAVRTTIRVVHRYVLRLQLGPWSSPGHVLGWRIVRSEPSLVRLEAESPLLGRGVIVGERPEPTRARVTTSLFFGRPALGRAIWTVVGPLHRRIAPYLMRRAAEAIAS